VIGSVKAFGQGHVLQAAQPVGPGAGNYHVHVPAFQVHVHVQQASLGVFIADPVPWVHPVVPRCLGNPSLQRAAASQYRPNIIIRGRLAREPVKGYGRHAQSGIAAHCTQVGLLFVQSGPKTGVDVLDQCIVAGIYVGIYIDNSVSVLHFVILGQPDGDIMPSPQRLVNVPDIRG
jgi:hypothetical protein